MKHSKLSIATIILGFLFFPAAIITGLIDIIKGSKEEKHILTYVGLGIAVLMLIVGVVNYKPSSQDTADLASSEEASAQEETEKPAKTIDTNTYIKLVTEAINEGALGENESLTDVSLNDRTLLIKLDFSKADPAPITMDDLILSRTGSITDAILDLTDYEELWDFITCDFGEAGKITNGKDNIVMTPVGKAFDSANFVIEK